MFNKEYTNKLGLLMIPLLINYDKSLCTHIKLCHKYYMFFFISEGIDVILSVSLSVYYFSLEII